MIDIKISQLDLLPVDLIDDLTEDLLSVTLVTLIDRPDFSDRHCDNCCNDGDCSSCFSSSDLIMIFDDTHGPSLVSHFSHYVTRNFS